MKKLLFTFCILFFGCFFCFSANAQVTDIQLEIVEVKCDSVEPIGPAIRLDWNDILGIWKYNIYRNDYFYINTMTDSYFYNSANVVAGNSYTYRIEAVDYNNNVVAVSNEVTAYVKLNICEEELCVDSDGDGICDDVDMCVSDPNKSNPGICGCGVDDVDSDGDGIMDCNDMNDCVDLDNDGVCVGDDCNDNDPSVWLVRTYYRDIDGDGFGDSNYSLIICGNLSSYVLMNGDCDDQDSKVNPSATEICYDDLDNNCNGIVDEGCSPDVQLKLSFVSWPENVARVGMTGYEDMRIWNVGSSIARNVRVTEVLPIGMIFDNGSNKKTWLLGDVAPDDTKQITYQFDVNSFMNPGQYIGSVDLTSDSGQSANFSHNIMLIESQEHIYVSKDSCCESAIDCVHDIFDVGDSIYINGSGYYPNQMLDYDIIGNENGIKISSGDVSVDALGNFCAYAHTVASGEQGPYTFSIDDDLGAEFYIVGAEPVLEYIGYEGYLDDAVEPNNLNFNESLDFKVIYKDLDNNEPKYVNIYINDIDTVSWKMVDNNEYYSYSYELSDCPSYDIYSAYEMYGIGQNYLNCDSIDEEGLVILDVKKHGIRSVSIPVASVVLASSVGMSNYVSLEIYNEEEELLLKKEVTLTPDTIDYDENYFKTKTIDLNSFDQDIRKIKISTTRNAGIIIIGDISFAENRIVGVLKKDASTVNYLYRDNNYINGEQYNFQLNLTQGNIYNGKYHYYFNYSDGDKNLFFPEEQKLEFSVDFELFKPDRDGYQFVNHGLDTSTLSDFDWGNFKNDLKLDANFIYLWANLKKSMFEGGLCYGMSLAAIGEYNGNYSFYNDQGYNNTYSVENSRFTTAGNFLSGDGYDGSNLDTKPILKHMMKNHTYQLIDNRISGVEKVKNELINELNSNNKYILNIRKNFGDISINNAAHSLVPIYIDEIVSNKYVVYLYDTNYPNSVQTLDIYNDGGNWRWYYSRLNWGGQDKLLQDVPLTFINSTISLTPISEVNPVGTWDFVVFTSENDVKILDLENDCTTEINNGIQKECSDDLKFINLSSSQDNYGSSDNPVMIRGRNVMKYHFNINNNDVQSGYFDLFGVNNTYLNINNLEGANYNLSVNNEGSEILLNTPSGINSVNYKKTVNSTEKEIIVKYLPDLLNGQYEINLNWDTVNPEVLIKIDEDGNGEFEKTIMSDNELTQEEFILQTELTMNCDPNNINLSKNGKWMTCYLELPEEFDPYDVDGSTVKLNGVSAYLGKQGWAKAEGNEGNVFDYDDDGIMERMFKFDINELISQVQKEDELDLLLAGDIMYEGEALRIQAYDSVIVMDKQKKEKLWVQN